MGYDDWWVLPCGKGNEALSPLEVGEGRAHVEMATKYDVEFWCAAGPCASRPSGGHCNKHAGWGPIFVVLSIGEGRGTHGFAMGDEQIQEFKSKSEDCQRHALGDLTLPSNNKRARGRPPLGARDQHG